MISMFRLAGTAPARFTSLLLLPGLLALLSVREAAGQFRFTDVAEEAGLDRVVDAGRPDKDHLLDSAGTGAAWLDFDRDGFLDAYIVNSWLMDGVQITRRGRNALYKNRGDGTFEDVTDRAGVAGEGHWGSGVAVADFDAGRLDRYPGDEFRTESPLPEPWRRHF